MEIYFGKFSKKIRILRERRDLTQEELAEKLGISRQSIISVEKGKCLPSLPLALRLAQLFEIPIEKIFFGEENNEKGGVKTMPRSLMPWSPFSDIDRVFEDDEFPSPWRRMRGLAFPAVNVKETPKAVVLTADIPGVKEEELNIEIGESFVDLTGERQEESKEEEEGYFRQEVRFGSFSRRIPLPTEVRADKAEATIKNGLLTLIIPKMEEAKPKVTKVKVKKA